MQAARSCRQRTYARARFDTDGTLIQADQIGKFGVSTQIKDQEPLEAANGPPLALALLRRPHPFGGAVGGAVQGRGGGFRGRAEAIWIDQTGPDRFLL